LPYTATSVVPASPGQLRFFRF